jgi:uncharacterized protein (DUF1501 family)
MFFYGGNDSSNMVLRTDMTSFAEYTRLRSTLPDSIALLPPGTAVNNGATRASPARLGGALALAPKFAVSPENNAFTYAVHPVMTEVQSLFGAGRLAILANAGPLVVPLTRTDYTSNSKPRPQALGSHNDQQSTWQALGPEGVKIGWGGLSTSTSFLARREDEDALNRSDRQRASSTNPSWRSIGSDHAIGMEPR